MNDLLIKNVVVIPVVARPGVAAVANNLHAPPSGGDSDLFAVQDWYRARADRWFRCALPSYAMLRHVPCE